MLDLLAFNANISNPMLAAAIRTASNIELELLIEAGDPLFELVNDPSRETLCLGDGQFAEFSACASDGSAPK